MSADQFGRGQLASEVRLGSKTLFPGPKSDFSYTLKTTPPTGLAMSVSLPTAEVSCLTRTSATLGAPFKPFAASVIFPCR
jgi:hypothetical protein